MLEIGQRAKEFRGDGSRIKGIVEELKYNIIYMLPLDLLALTTANAEKIYAIPFKRWRVIGISLNPSYAITTNGEDPVIHVGKPGDSDYFAIFTFTYGAAEKTAFGDIIIYDKYGILGETHMAAGSVAVTEGTGFDNWENNLCLEIKNLSGALTTGYFSGGIVIEIDTGGKW